MERNLRILEEAALPYLGPVISARKRGGMVWCIALLKVAGSKYAGDEIYEEIYTRSLHA